MPPAATDVQQWHMIGDSSSLAYVRVGVDGYAGVHALGKQPASVAGNATCSSHGSSSSSSA
jgi:hypothetical protein